MLEVQGQLRETLSQLKRKAGKRGKKKEKSTCWFVRRQSGSPECAVPSFPSLSLNICRRKEISRGVVGHLESGRLGWLRQEDGSNPKV